MKHQNTPSCPSASRRLPDAAIGLCREEVLLRQEQHLTNTPVRAREKSVLQIVLSNLFTYFNLLFFLLALCLVLVGSEVKNLLFLGVVFCNTVITTVQELRAKRMLDRLKLVSAPRIKTVREGAVCELASEALVLDDVVQFFAGNQIPADAVVLQGAVRTNEALVTGESDEIEKGVGDTLLSGSFVVGGSCTARLTAVGGEAFVSRLTLEAKRHKKPEKPGMMRSLSLLVRGIGFLVLPLGAVLFCRQVFLQDLGTKEAMQSTVTTLIGMIPEGLYLLVSAALALAVIRLGRRGVLSHTLGSVETLARVDVLCLDKTGTITENEMSFAGLFEVGGAPISEETEALLARFCAASDADNSTIATLKQTFFAPDSAEALLTVPFSSRYKFSGVSFADSSLVLGAPEVLLGERFQESGAQALMKSGLRLLVFATCDGFANDRPTGVVRPLCFVGLKNKVRQTAVETFRYFEEQGVAIKVISGDNPAAVSAVAQAAGIRGAESCVDATTLTTDEELFDAAARFTVFGRVTPEQKRTLVRALRTQGHTVCMTGDGVNDVLALKEADCSVAMASGSDVAANVSHLVLLENDFSTMPSVVAEGRQVINNIQRSASLYLVKNIFSFCLAILLLLAPLTYPLQPIQLTLLSTLTIGVPSFFLALEPNRERVRGAFLTNVLSRALPAGLTDFALLGAVMVLSHHVVGFGAEQAATVMTLLLCLVGFLFLLWLSRPLNRFRSFLILLLFVSCCVAILFFGGFFKLFALSALSWRLLCALALGGALLFFAFAALQKRLFARFEKPSK